MESHSTVTLRPICQRVNDTIGNLPTGPFNFGLYFNKWFYVVDGNARPPKGLKKKSRWSCPTSVDSVLERRHEVHPQQCKLLDNLNTSLVLFNGASREDKWDRRQAEQMLSARHVSLAYYCESFRKLGYWHETRKVGLSSPLIVGLGNEHPSEKGFRFDWTLGIPMIPSSSIKGVVRLAFLVNRLNSFEDPDDPSLLEFCYNIQKDGTFPEPARSIFGSGGDERSNRGKVIFLDAYPEKLPRLKAEIMNCHYPDYLNKGTRGPTEDQDPNPQRYWAVDPNIDDKGTKVSFVFRFLIHKDIANDQDKFRQLFEAVHSALGDHGLGAKTAIGHGRFDTKGTAKSEQDRAKAPAEASPKDKPAADKVIEQWAAVNVNWDAGRQEVNATSGNKKGFTKDRSVVSEILCKTLFDKKKVVKANVTVEPLGGNNFRIIVVNPVDQ